MWIELPTSSRRLPTGLVRNLETVTCWEFIISNRASAVVAQCSQFLSRWHEYCELGHDCWTVIRDTTRLRRWEIVLRLAAILANYRQLNSYRRRDASHSRDFRLISHSFRWIRTQFKLYSARWQQEVNIEKKQTRMEILKGKIKYKCTYKSEMNYVVCCWCKYSRSRTPCSIAVLNLTASRHPVQAVTLLTRRLSSVTFSLATPTSVLPADLSISLGELETHAVSSDNLVAYRPNIDNT